MDQPIVITIIRLIHIFSGIAWAGSAIVLGVYLLPTVRAHGPEGDKFFSRFLTGRFGAAIAISGVVTTLAGIALYATGPQNRFSQLGFIILSVGALAGLGAAGHGGAVFGKLSAKYCEAVAKGSPEVPALREEYIRHGNISMYLAIIAIIGMASARYL